MVHPSSDELEEIARVARVEEEFIRAALDPEESSRVETEDDQLFDDRRHSDGGEKLGRRWRADVQHPANGDCSRAERGYHGLPDDSIILRSIAEGAVKRRPYGDAHAVCVPDLAAGGGSLSEKPAHD